MPRQPRLWEPGDILSIVGRGHEGRPLFATDDDRRFFVERMRKVLAPGDVDLHAWALMSNHYHLVIRITDVPPETLFRRLNTSIGMRVRRRSGDYGATLQGRYWSGRCEQEGSVVAVLSYVLGNPVHHGVLADEALLEWYPWTACPEVLGRSSPGLVDVPKTLALIHHDPETARDVLRDALAARVVRWRSERAGIDPCEEPGCRGARDGCLLVHPRRTRRVLPDASPALPPDSQSLAGITTVHDERADRRARLRARGWLPSDLVEPVCARLGADPAAVLAGRRHPRECAARAVVAHVACDGVATPGADVARLLGVSEAAVSAARHRGRVVLSSRGWSVDDALSWTAPGR